VKEERGERREERGERGEGRGEQIFTYFKKFNKFSNYFQKPAPS
jgi:hypothetical protein